MPDNEHHLTAKWACNRGEISEETSHLINWHAN
jgi:hypothetical protein